MQGGPPRAWRHGSSVQATTGLRHPHLRFPSHAHLAGEAPRLPRLASGRDAREARLSDYWQGPGLGH